MITFLPVWLTPVGALPSVTENDAVSVGLQAVRSATFMAEENQTVAELGSSAAHVTDVYVNTSLLPTSAWDVAGNTLIFVNPLNANDVVRVDTDEALKFSLLHDTLPPGLTLSEVSGQISGTVGRLPTDGPPVTYSFAVRIFDGKKARDRQFTIEAIPTDFVVTPPAWGHLPAEKLKVASPRSFRYVPLGRATRGKEFSFEIDIFKPGGVPPTLSVELILDSTTIQSPFNDMPPGLTLDEHTGLISGVIDPEAELGDYIWRIRMRDNRGNDITTGSGSAPKAFMLTVAPPDQALEPLKFIRWTTPEGHLGDVYENQTYPGGVFATCTTGQTVNYRVAENTPLPDGLTLNQTTGDIEGIVAHLPRDRLFEFTIRAYVGDTYSDRNFSIKALSRYTTGNVVNVNFKLRVNDLKPMLAYYPTVINVNEFFRPTDPNFGTIGNELSIYIVGGIGANAAQFESVLRASPYGGPVTLYLGDHKIAYAKLNGQTVYEVLYREVIDPAELADQKTRYNPVGNPRDPLRPRYTDSDARYVHPTSLENIRAEMIEKLGFPTIDEAARQQPEGFGENMPLWMNSPQTGNQSSSIIGYKPAVVLAYLKPGTGKAVLDRISTLTFPEEREWEDPNPLKPGHQIDFDQYFAVIQSLTPQTIFLDANRLVSNAGVWETHAQATARGEATFIQLFDEGLTIWDEFVIYEGKYFRINPKVGGPS